MTTDPQTAADAAERVQAFLDARASAAVSDVIATVIPDIGTTSQRFPLTAGDLAALLADRARLAAELEQARRTVATPILRQAWRNGWSDRARAVRDSVRVSDNERDAYERAFARYMSEDPAEADKDPYRPLDGPDDPAAVPTRPAGGMTGPAEGPQDTQEGP